MIKSIDFLTVFFLLFLGFVVSSCEKESENTIACSTEVLYKGTAVCYQGEKAAAIAFVNAPNDYLILTNFFDLIEEENIEFDDSLNINYENIDSSLMGSGILCGPLIVAPVADLTCLEKL